MVLPIKKKGGAFLHVEEKSAYLLLVGEAGRWPANESIQVWTLTSIACQCNKWSVLMKLIHFTLSGWWLSVMFSSQNFDWFDRSCLKIPTTPTFYFKLDIEQSLHRFGLKRFLENIFDDFFLFGTIVWDH